MAEDKEKRIAYWLSKHGQIPRISVTRSSGSHKMEPLCFNFTFVEGAGCNGSMKMDKKWVPCTHHHVDIASDDWKSFSAEDIKEIVDYLKRPAIQKVVQATTNFADTDQFRQAS
jgi:hypothetical protein